MSTNEVDYFGGHNIENHLADKCRLVKLGNICEIIAGQSPPSETYRNYPEGLPFFQGKADFGEKYPVPRTWCVAPIKIALPGDILISVRAPVGPTNIADQKCCIGRGLASIRPKEDTDRDFILAFLKYYEEKLSARGSGSVFGAIRISDLESIMVPQPPINQQRRIASSLSKKMEAIALAGAATGAQLSAAKALPAAYLREVFEGSEANGWAKKQLGDVGEIVSGVTLGRVLRNSSTARKVPYLRVANVKDGYLDLSDINFIEASEEEIKKLNLKYGDILLTEGGDPDKLGRGTFWRDQISECIHQNHIFRVRFDLKRFSPEFISYQIGSSYGKKYFLDHAKQTTGIATINQKVLRKFALMSPSLTEQKRIVDYLDEMMACSDKTLNALEDQMKYIEQLPAKILQKAFNGELLNGST